MLKDNLFNQLFIQLRYIYIYIYKSALMQTLELRVFLLIHE